MLENTWVYKKLMLQFIYFFKYKYSLIALHL